MIAALVFNRIQQKYFIRRNLAEAIMLNVDVLNGIIVMW